MIRLSNASPAIGTPSVPMISDVRRPRCRTPGPTEMIVKSLVPPPKSPIRIRSSRSRRASYAYAAATGSYSKTISSKPASRIAASRRSVAKALRSASAGLEK